MQTQEILFCIFTGPAGKMPSAISPPADRQNQKPTDTDGYGSSTVRMHTGEGTANRCPLGVNSPVCG